MIKKYVERWDNKSIFLREFYELTLRDTVQSYDDIVRNLFQIVINDVDGFVRDTFSTDKMTVIDDGDYQGALIYVVPNNAYQPRLDDYVFIEVFYGSCSGCDTLQQIKELNDYESEHFTERQVDDLMSLSLNIIQSIKSFKEGK